MLLFIGLLLFVLLIVVHEYGHFLVAKRNGVEVEEFGIGFPPKLVGKKMGKGIFESYYTLNLLPLGGFVKLKGENDADTRKGSLGAASLRVKAKIMLAGVAMNFVTAAIILTILSVAGMPQAVDNQFKIASDTTVSSSKVVIAEPVENSPAAQAGLEAGDQILSLNSEQITSADQLRSLTEANASSEITLGINSGGEQREEAITLNSGGDDGYLGVAPVEITLERSTWSAPIRGFGLAVQFTLLTIEGLAGTIGSLVSGAPSEAAEQVSGPIGIFTILRDGTLVGYEFVLLIIALLSVTLAVMNSLPIPGLDGGRLALTLVFRAMKKKLTPEIEQKIVGVGMTLLLLLIALITIVDIQRFF